MDEEDFFNYKQKEDKAEQKKKEKEEEKRILEEEAKRIAEQQLAKKRKKKQQDEESEPKKSIQPQDIQLDEKKQTKKQSKKQLQNEYQLIAKQNEALKPAQIIEREIGKNYFIVPDEVPMEINKALIAKEDNLVRRWKVFINEIRLENLQKEQLTVFLNFKIGMIGANANKFEDISSQEVFFKSEICKDLKRSEVKVIKVMFEAEMHLSYQMLKERYFVIEVWEYRRFRLNLFLGKIKVSLLNIATGNIKRQDDIKKEFGDRRQFARIYYNILFQEVWDYKLTFEAWKGENIIADKGESYDPKIELTLMTEELMKPTVSSNIIPKTQNPNFRTLKGFMHYRGTMEDLTQQMMKVTIYKNEYFKLTEKLTSMRGIQDTNYLKVQVRLKPKDMPKRGYQQFQNTNKEKKKKKNPKQRLQEEDFDDDEDNDDELLRDEAFIAIVEGRINLNKQPRYGQNGELNTYIPDEYYLVITVNRLNNVLSPDDRGVINTFLAVAWRDQIKCTRVIKNDPNPTYNEELYFRIPILKREMTFDDIINQKTEKDLLIDALREELKSRPDITISLWLDGMDILSDESLGYCRVFISEIQKAQKFKKTLLTDDNKKYLFDTREATFTKKFESGLFNVNHIQITFQCFFAPDLPEDLDLGEFCELVDEIYPYQIQDQLRVGRDHEDNDEYKQWDRLIRENFSQISLEKTAYNIFFKNIFVKDQYNYYHLICKYLEKFYVRYANQEATKELFANPLDIRMKGIHELCHFVRNIPFIQDSFSRNDVWRSPDFLLKVRKGFIHDHAVLAACLLMGFELEDKELANEKNYIPFEHRVFVCLGTLKHNHAFHAWIMIYSHDLSNVHMWDVQEDFNLNLVGRVKKSQRADLRRFLYREKPKAKKKDGNIFLKGFQTGEKKLSKKELRRQEIRRQQAEKKKKEEEIAQKKREREKEAQKEQEEKIKNARQTARFQVDDVDNQEEQTVELNEFDNKGATVKIKNYRQMGMTLAESKTLQNPQSTVFSKTSSKTKGPADRKTQQKSMFQNPFVNQFRGDDQKETAIQAREREEEEIRKRNPIAKFTKQENFMDKNNSPVEDQGQLPYASVEIVFNNKNMFANLGNWNPQEIYYHLHNRREWLPFITEYIAVDDGKQKQEDTEDEEDDDEYEEDDELLRQQEEDEAKQQADAEILGYRTATWNRKLGAFYSAQILKEPIKKNKIKVLLEDIFMEIKQGVEKARGKLGLFTKWKKDLDTLNKKMEQYLKILEYRTTNRPIAIVQNRENEEVQYRNQVINWNEIYKSKEYDYIISQWKKEVKLMLPLNCHLCILPMRFTYTQSEKIRSVVVENMSEFFMRKESKIIFNLAGKIFNYPNKIVCVRLILGYTYSQAQDEQKKQNEDIEEEPKEENPIIDTEKPILENLDEEDDEQKELLKIKEINNKQQE